MEKVFISGGTGLVGTRLSEVLRARGYEVVSWSRSQSATLNEVMDADYIIHLAGANIGEKRWTAVRKKAILSSRVKTAKLLYDTLKNADPSVKRLKAFISASAIGYYGAITQPTPFHETHPPANDFLGKTCQQWEAAADSFQELGARVVKLRTGLVLAHPGGALDKMLIPVKMGLSSPLGSGRQFTPWVHVEDLCAMYLFALENETLNGAFNAAAPSVDTNADLMRALAKALHKPYWAPAVPAFALRLVLGEQAALVLAGSPVSSEKILQAGFQFLYPSLEKALKNLFEKPI